MSCQDDANFVGPISLFLGVETANWSMQQFLDEGVFCKQQGISTLFIKVAEAGGRNPDIWYGGINGFDIIYQRIKALGVNVIPYQFCYGGALLSRDIDIAAQFLSKYSVHCLDLEGTPWVGPVAGQWATQMAAALHPIPGRLWLSHPSDFLENNQGPFMQAIAPATSVFMPMVYSDHLNQMDWLGEIHSVNPNACVQPTLDLSAEFGANNAVAIAQHAKSLGCQALSLWYEGFANTNPARVDQVVSAFKGGSVTLNSKGMVCDIVQSNQLFEQEPDLCGPWSVASLLGAGKPNQGPLWTAEQIDQWADAAVFDMGYPNPKDFPGVSIPNEEWLIQRSGLHYQEVPSTIENIRIAIKAGYPVIITAYEPNILAWDFRSNSWVHAYTWNISANHVLPVGGIDQNGNLICADQLNNAFQGYWPPIYDASRINPSYAAIIRLPWLAPIPGGDPRTWPSGFNAQGGSMPIPTGWKDDGKTLTAPNGHKVVLGSRAHVLAAPTWDSNDQPLMEEASVPFVEENNPALGSGARQIFDISALEYTTSRGVQPLWMGKELMFLLADRNAKAAALVAANAEIALLKAAPPPVPPQPPVDLSAVKAALSSAVSVLGPLVQAGSDLETALKALPQ